MKHPNFNSGSFIENAKQLMPQYLNSLKNKDISEKSIQFIKNVLLVFLKDYINNNNSKYNQYTLDVVFIKRFLHDLIPEKHSKLAAFPVNKIQAVILNFINFLTVKQVLNVSIRETLARTLAEHESPKKRIKSHSRSLTVEEEEESEYSEEFRDDLLQRTKKLTNLFFASPHAKNFMSSQVDDGKYVILRFTDYMYEYFLLTPETWDADALEEICLEIFPRKISANLDWFKVIHPVLTEYFIFLQESKIMDKVQANELQMRLHEISDLIVDHAADSRNWGIAKSMMMDAMEAGIDMNDEEEFNSFLQLKVLEHNSKIDERPHSTRR